MSGLICDVRVSLSADRHEATGLPGRTVAARVDARAG